MIGVLVLIGVVLRWVGRGLIRVAEWFDPEPLEPLYWALEPFDDGPDAAVIDLFEHRRRA